MELSFFYFCVYSKKVFNLHNKPTNMRFGILCFLFLSPFFTLFAQLPPEQLSNQQTFTNLDDAVAKKDKVYKLRLSNQKLTEFPKEILLLTNLQELYLEKNKKIGRAHV